MRKTITVYAHHNADVTVAWLAPGGYVRQVDVLQPPPDPGTNRCEVCAPVGRRMAGERCPVHPADRYTVTGETA